ncbi:MAG: hypothetical protein E4G98_03335 [Promethearchaeota archaeon]|nr:MAG: hypothetical protein E4G98_03335 [Candidatus Lokiarchaeota archaeon]
MEHQKKLRIGIATGFGMLMGVLCVLGQSQRMPANPLPNATIYLLGAWYNRVLMGILIGCADDWQFVKKKSRPILNAIIRGALLGTLVSISFGLLQQSLEIIYFLAGIVWGILIDTLTTWILHNWEKKPKNKRN